MTSFIFKENNFLTLSLLLIIFVLINSLISNKFIRIIIALFSSVFLIAQSFALYSMDSFINYQFYVHANLRGVAGMEGLFVKQIIISIVVFLFLWMFFFFSPKIYELLNNILRLRKIKLMKAIAAFIFIPLIITLMHQEKFISDTKSLLPIFASNDIKEFKTVLHKYHMDDYTIPSNIESVSGNNIIIISMESLEQGFLSSKFQSLTPNLNKLKNKWKYLEIEQNAGSGWTSGSLYTYLTGFPAYFGTDGNKIFQTAYHTDISGISHAMRKAGYTITYLNGNTNHSGIKEMLNIFEVSKIIDYKNANVKNLSSYGLRDKDLFNIAKKEIKDLSQSKKPFVLIISTTDTHFPNGIYDKRMETVIPKKETDLFFCVASLDYLVGDYISYLEKNDIFKNTTIYLFPDHLKMGDASIFENTGKRELYCITNSDRLPDYKEQLYQIDLPKIILNGAGIKHNLKFLTDYINGDKNNWIKKHRTDITEINISGILNPKIKSN